MKHVRHRIFSLGVLLFVCLFAAAEPFRIANAALDKANTMPCCVGKTAGHCESGIGAKKVSPPKSEPMCGREDAARDDDAITIVAEPVAESPHSHSQAGKLSSSQPAVESASLSGPCHMDCGACATSATRQQNRERSIVLSHTYAAASPTTSSKYEDKSVLLSANDNWPRTIPRGPPAHR
jgi:hypothetical protein